MAGDAALASRAQRRKQRRRLTEQPWWPTARRVFTVLFLAGVLALVVYQARQVEWPSVLRTLRQYSPRVLLGAAALAALSHALYSGYDLIGRRQTGHRLPVRESVGTGFVSYAFNINLGSLVGGLAMRFRLYARLGLKADAIAEVLALSLITNWLGYLFIGGLVFALAPIALPPDWKLDSSGLRYAGFAMVLAAAAYVGLCFFSRRREWTVRGRRLSLPHGRLASLQLALSTANWAVMAGVVWVLLGRQIDYASVLTVLLIAAVAGVIAHVPAGLGVIEAVFVALLSHRVARHDLIAALLAYRAIYYLAPLALALPVFFALDAHGRKG
jgi:uncharacterized membrane protein YbhN (UPF0104 family)